MTGRIIVKYLNPWKLKRQREAERLAALRARDGDDCARCRRPIHFDRPQGHELAVKIEQISPGLRANTDVLANLCLTHGRCNAQGRDHTEEVLERLRPAREAELFTKARKKRAA